VSLLASCLLYGLGVPAALCLVLGFVELVRHLGRLIGARVWRRGKPLPELHAERLRRLVRCVACGAYCDDGHAHFCPRQGGKS